MPHTRTVSAHNRRATEAQARITAILRAATALFRTQGYEATSLRQVLARSGGSKATLRKYFGSKPGLFSAVVAEVTGQFVADAHLRDAQGTPAEVLTAIGRSVLGFYMRQDALQAYRGVVGGGFRDARMARSFHEKGHLLVRDALAQRLSTWVEAGLVASPDCADDADHFLHLLRAGSHEQALIGLRKSVPAAELEQRVARAVQIFLGGVAA
ncbi:MAG: hypothetical protein RL684_3037 [Pseudomonadota bacterium]|jgi:AcrR family transcriptional regulator